MLVFVAVVVVVLEAAVVVVVVDGSCDHHNEKVRADEKSPWCQPNTQQVLPARAER